MRILKVLFILAAMAFAGTPTQAQDPSWLGVRFADLSKDEATALGWPRPRGAKIVAMIPRGPAALDGREIEGYRDFSAQLRQKPPGSELHLKFVRQSKEAEAVVTDAGSNDELDKLGRSIAAEPNSILARLARAELLFRLNRAAEAMPDCEQVIEVAPNDGRGYHCRAQVLIVLDKLDAALEDLAIAAHKMPRFDAVFVTRASVHARKGDYDAAIEDLNRVLALYDRNPEALAARGEAYLAKGLIDRALDDFKAALAIDRNNQRANKGVAAALTKRNAQAPQNPPAPAPSLPGPVATPSPPAQPPSPAPATTAVDPELKTQVDQLLPKRQFKEALELVDKAIGQASSNAGLHNLRGVVLRAGGDLIKAIEAFDRAASLVPQYAEAHVNRITARLALRRTADAKQSSEVFIKLFPELGLAYDLRARAFIQEKKYVEARADLDQAIAKDPKLVDAWIDRGQVYLLEKDYDKAISDLSRAIELDAKSDAAYGLRGKVYLAKKEPQLAIVDLHKALSINELNWNAVSSLQGLQVAKALEQMGQIK